MKRLATWWFFLIFAIAFCGANFPQEVLGASNTKKASLAYSYYMMGLLFDFEGQAQEALKEYLKAAKLEPDNSEIHLRIGAAYTKLNKIPEPIEEFKLATELNPDNLESHFLLA